MKAKKYENLIRLTAYVGRHKSVFVFSVICGVMSNVFTLVSLLLGVYLTGLAFGGANGEEILRYFPALFLLIAGKGLFAYLHMLVCHKMAYLVFEDIRGDVYDAALRATPLTGVKYRTGDISSIIMEDVEALESFFAHMFSDYLITLICMLLFVGAYLFLSWKAALISLVASLVIAAVPYLFGKRDRENGKVLRELLGETNAGVVDTIQGLNEILIFGREEKYIRKVMDDTMRLNRYEVADGKIKGAQAGLIGLVLSSVLILVILLSHKMVLAQEIEPKMVGVFITMSLNIFLPVVMVSSTAGRLNTVVASADRIQMLLNESSPLRETDPALPSVEENSLLSLRAVDFSYDPSAKVLSGLNLEIRKGENIALTGESGAGKTTLVHLLLRFYDPEAGEIYLRGKNLRSMSAEEVRQDVAYVPQDVYLFHGTVLDNLRLGRPDATMEEVRNAARIALADGFIEALDDGYDSFVGERGLTLSGGQKQRLAIARALVTGASVLIMDEAVSNLDTESEALFRQALENVRREKTILTVAHRRSTILEAERVIVLKDGRIALDATPEEWKQYTA